MNFIYVYNRPLAFYRLSWIVLLISLIPVIAMSQAIRRISYR